MGSVNHFCSSFPTGICQIWRVRWGGPLGRFWTKRRVLQTLNILARGIVWFIIRRLSQPTSNRSLINILMRSPCQLWVPVEKKKEVYYLLNLRLVLTTATSNPWMYDVSCKVLFYNLCCHFLPFVEAFFFFEPSFCVSGGNFWWIFRTWSFDYFMFRFPLSCYSFHAINFWFYVAPPTYFSRKYISVLAFSQRMSACKVCSLFFHWRLFSSNFSVMFWNSCMKEYYCIFVYGFIPWMIVQVLWYGHGTAQSWSSVVFLLTWTLNVLKLLIGNPRVTNNGVHFQLHPRIRHCATPWIYWIPKMWDAERRPEPRNAIEARVWIPERDWSWWTISGLIGEWCVCPWWFVLSPVT